MSEINSATIERAIFEINYIERDIDKTTRIGKDRIDALELALKLMSAELERKKNPPLTMKELSELASHDPVFGTHCFVKDVYTGKVFNALVDVDSTGIAVMVGSSKQMDIYEHGRKWLAYRYEPKGEKA